jgi:hypothetical protein
LHNCESNLYDGIYVTKNIEVSEKRRDMNNFNDREIDILLNLSISSDTNWEIVICSSNEWLLALVSDLFIDDPQVSIKSCGNICDLIITLATDVPDLLIIDDKLPSASVKELVNCIRRTEFLKKIKIFYNLTSPPSIVEKVLEVDEYFSQDNLDKIYISRKLNSRLYQSTTHHDKRVLNKLERIWPRINLEVDARIEVLENVYSIGLDYGTALIKNISFGGAGISKIQLKKGRLPAGDCYIRLQVNKPLLESWTADSKIIRANGHDVAGLKFVNISKNNKYKILDLFE